MACGRPFSRIEKSSLVRVLMISPFLVRTTARRSTTFTEVENVALSWLRASEPAASAAAEAKKLRREQRSGMGLSDAIPGYFRTGSAATLASLPANEREWANQAALEGG